MTVPERPTRILVVDDEEQIRRALKSILSTRGYALEMGMAAARRVAFGSDEDVVAHRMELEPAERAAVRRRLEAPHRADRVPLGRLEPRPIAARHRRT